MLRFALATGLTVLFVAQACGGRSSSDPYDYEAVGGADAIATNGTTTTGMLAGVGGAINGPISATVGPGGMSTTTGGMSTTVATSATSGGMSTTSGGMSTTVATSATSGGMSTTVATSATSGGMTATVATSATSGGMTATVATSAASGGAASCISCTFTKCTSALQCIQNQACLNGASCTLQKCVSGGQPDFACALACFNGDITAATDAIDAVTCVLTNCASECQGGFGG